MKLNGLVPFRYDTTLVLATIGQSSTLRELRKIFWYKGDLNKNKSIPY